MRKPAFCICENKDTDHFCDNREADQCLFFCYTDSTIPLLPKSEISSHLPYSVAVQPGLCGTRSNTWKTGFLTTRLILVISTLNQTVHCKPWLMVCCKIVAHRINTYRENVRYIESMPGTKESLHTD